MALSLRNPHSVLAAFAERPEDVVDVRLGSARPSGAWEEVVAVAGQHRVPVLREPALPDRTRRRRSPDEPGRGGSTEATVKEKLDVALDALFGTAKAHAQGGALWLALDGIQDPHNLGAVFRSAAFFGIKGIVLTRDRSAPMNATVYDVSSGGIEYVPFSVQANLARAIEVAKESGLWVLGSSERAETDVAGIDRGRPWLLVLGNEEKGLRRLTAERCDELCRLSPQGRVSSLNVSVAAGVLMSALSHGQPQ